ncbi:hypothetical protein E1B28_013266 [Marasmius oreades]|uniref:Uncharacterized protein n=1 Tax=Marasmius oreades TaxID=181124 RepID=A0A9P7UMH6_9AGAR|nr:uncharacterized protein E1B28_013266 [Marasmius oreades]KAG7087288.1 hypothetical protein E1B28_013266 [Marasmius oreades]
MPQSPYLSSNTLQTLLADPRIQYVRARTHTQPDIFEQVLDMIVQNHESFKTPLVTAPDPSDINGKAKLSDEFVDLFCSACQQLEKIGLLAPLPVARTSNPQPSTDTSQSTLYPFTTANPRVSSPLRCNPYTPLIMGSKTAQSVPTPTLPAFVDTQTASSSLNNSAFRLHTSDFSTTDLENASLEYPKREKTYLIDKDNNGIMIQLFDPGENSFQVFPTSLQAKRLTHAFPTLPSHLLNGLCKVVPPFTLTCPIHGCLARLKDSELSTVYEHLDFHFALGEGPEWRNSELTTPKKLFGCCNTELKGSSLPQHIIDIHFQTKLTWCRFCRKCSSRPQNHFARHLFQCEVLKRFRVMDVSEVQVLEKGPLRRKRVNG